MHLEIEMNEGLIIVRPTNEQEYQVLSGLRNKLGSEPTVLKRLTKKTDEVGNILLIKFGLQDGTEFDLTPSSDADRKLLWEIRDYLLMRASLVYLGGEGSTIENFQMRLTGRCCRLCGKGMLLLDETSWGTCSLCRPNCEHQLVTAEVKEGKDDGKTVALCIICGGAFVDGQLKPAGYASYLAALARGVITLEE